MCWPFQNFNKQSKNAIDCCCLSKYGEGNVVNDVISNIDSYTTLLSVNTTAVVVHLNKQNILLNSSMSLIHFL